MKKSYMKIVNFKQANFLYQQGATIENLGYSYETGTPYVRFVSDDIFKEKMTEWQNKSKKI